MTMREVLLGLGALGILATLAWLGDLVRRAVLKLVALRQTERDAAFHDGFCQGLEIGSGAGDKQRRIAERAKRFQR